MHSFDLSIIVLTYNAETYVEECLNSILSQTFTGTVQLLILDDHSTDHTAQVVQHLINTCNKTGWSITFETNENNLGSYLNLQKGIQKSTGKYIAYMEGDDCWTDVHKLSKQCDFLKANTDYDAHACGCIFIDETGKTINQLFYKGEKARPYRNSELWGYPPFQTSGLMFRNLSSMQLPKSTINTNCNDKILFVLCSLSKPIFYNPEKMVAYRYHSSNLTTNYTVFQNTVSRSVITNTWLLKRCGLKYLPAYISALFSFVKTYMIKALNLSKHRQ